MSVIVLSLATALLLAVVHVSSQALRFLREVPRSRFLSFAGGMSVSWVVLRTLPGIAEDQGVLGEASAAAGLPFVRHPSYLAVLASVLLYYSVDRLAKRSRQERTEREGLDRTTPSVLWIHVGSFALLNFLIGYALPGRASTSVQALLLFALAMFLKFIVSDHGLYAEHKEAYDRVGRWVLALAVLTGWATGYWTELPETGAALMRAFIAGGVLFNMLKEEMPAERQGKAWAFVAGAIVYAALLLIAA